MGKEEYLKEIAKLEDEIRTCRANIQLSERSIDDVDAAINELKAMEIWSKITTGNFEEKVYTFMDESHGILSQEQMQMARKLQAYQKDLREMVIRGNDFDEELQKWAKWMEKHGITINDIINQEICPCANLKYCTLHEKKMKKYNDLIEKLHKIGEVCLTIGAMQMWDKRKGEEKSSSFMKCMIPLIFAGSILLLLSFVLDLQRHKQSNKLKYLERICRILLLIVYMMGLAIAMLLISKGCRLLILQLI